MSSSISAGPAAIFFFLKMRSASRTSATSSFSTNATAESWKLKAIPR